MKKIIICDADGMVIKKHSYFSERLATRLNIPLQKILPFFTGPFQECLVGQADLKKEIQPYLSQWQWPGSIDDLLQFWFGAEQELDTDVLGSIAQLRQQGKGCFLATDNEKYRTEHLKEDLDFKNIFDGIFSSSSLGHKKSTREFWEITQNTFSTIPMQDVIVWDDDEKNVDAAQKYGYAAEFFSDFNTFRQKMLELE